jgi:hydroxymethylglutaryl-CoA lyase
MDDQSIKVLPGKIRMVECPRDAMQGWKNLIPTEEKIIYLNQLLQVGFDVLDFGSFVSPRAIPQMADTRKVMENLSVPQGGTKLLAIVANRRGAEQAAEFSAIHFLGFPFSVSETFQQKNTHSSISESLKRVEEIQGLCQKAGKELVLYLSMGFGNPYGDPYSPELVYGWVQQLTRLGIQIFSVADTVGLATAEQVFMVTDRLIQEFPSLEIGVHLHSRPENWRSKIDAALRAGCRRFDGALKGIGGCPMAGDHLVGNMNTEWMVAYFAELGLVTGIDMGGLARSADLAAAIFV